MMARAAVLVCLMLVWVGTALAAAPDRALTLRQGKADIVPLPASVSDIMVADPNIVSVVAVQPDKLYIVGQELGNTNIITLDAAGNTIARIDVHVTMDTKALQREIDRLFPDEDVTVSALHGKLILEGTVSTPEVANKVQSVVAYYLSSVLGGDATNFSENATILLNVRGDQQVLLKVRLVEASRTVLRELGTQTYMNGLVTDPETGSWEFVETGSEQAGGVRFLDNNGNALLTAAGSSLTETPLLNSTLWLDTGIDLFGYLGLELKALETEGLVNILAEPNLSALSGEEASFLAGGEFPIPAGRDNEGNLIIEYKPYGASLSFRPTVLSPDRISLTLGTEVSSLDRSESVTLSDVSVPGLKVRRASTTVEIPSGGTLVIAGILQSEFTKNLAGLPGVKDTPVLGDLISSDSFQRGETELVVMVTPYLVRPYEDDKAAPAKNTPPEPTPLQRAFVANLQRVYGALATADLLTERGAYGYILD